MKLGIDFGTSTSLAATVVTGTKEPENLTAGSGEYGIPSLVYVTPAGLLAGTAAKEAYTSYKSTLGDCRIRSAKIKLINNPVDKPAIMENGEKAQVKGVPLTYPDATASIISEVREVAVERARNPNSSLGITNTDIEAAVITVPSQLDPTRREKIRTVIMNALGLKGKPVQLVEEPAAAAVYAFYTKSVKGDAVLVYDMGAGTCDCAVVERIHTGKNDVYVEQNSDMCQIAGDRFDEEMIKIIERKMRVQNLKGRIEVETAKKQGKEKLSDKDKATIFVTGGSVTVTRKEFEDAIRPLLDETLQMVKKVISQYGKKIDAILCVGGSASMPAVQSILQEGFPEIPVIVGKEPALSIARGAALVAEGFASIESKAPTKYAYGILLHNRVEQKYYIYNLIRGGQEFELDPEDQKLKIMGSFANSFGRTVEQKVARQDKLHISVYRSVTQKQRIGEHEKDDDGHEPVPIREKAIDLDGHFDKDGIEYDVTMKLDTQGILHYEAHSNKGEEYDLVDVIGKENTGATSL